MAGCALHDLQCKRPARLQRVQYSTRHSKACVLCCMERNSRLGCVQAHDACMKLQHGMQHSGQPAAVLSNPGNS